MKISRVETFLVPPGWVFVRVEADTGDVGWGEIGVQTWATTVRAAITDMTQQILGADPRSIGHLWQTLTRGGFYSGGPTLGAAVAALDIALWDLTARSYGVPVHALLGGPVRQRVPAYAWVDELPGRGQASLEAESARLIADGYWGVKYTPLGVDVHPAGADLDAVVSRIEAARRGVGRNGRVAVDLHGRYNVLAATALLDRVGDLGLVFVEEPLGASRGDALQRLCARSPTPIAAGERAVHRTEFLDLMRAGVKVAQPDVAIAHGITETLAIARLVETFDGLLAPHCAVGPIALAATLQIGALVPNLLCVEQDADCFRSPFERYLLSLDPYVAVDGHIAVQTAPGLGIELDEAAIRAADGERPHRRPPSLQHRDGSVADW